MILIGYGSETGTAQGTAEYISRECTYRDIQSNLQPLNNVSVSDLQAAGVAVFVCSTTGDGEEPKNMKAFWRGLLNRSLGCETFSGLNVAVLGLGDSSYCKFNYVAKRLYRRLVGLGANSLLELGLSDEQHPEGSEYQSYHWVEKFFGKLSDHFSKPLVRTYRLLPPSVQFSIHPGPAAASPTAAETTGVYSKEEPFSASLVTNTRLTGVEHFQDVRLIGLDIAGSGWNYNPGDVLWVYPKNAPENVELAAKLLNLNLTDVVEVTRPWKLTTTVRELLTSHLDIMAVPERHFFELCSNFPSDPQEREKFEEFTDMKDTEELYSYVSRPKRTILEVLSDFHSVRENFDLRYLFDAFNPIKARGFSIASAQNVYPTTVQLCMGVVRYRTNLKKERVGLCSTWLSSLQLGSPVKVYLEPGSFTFPTDRPIIMVGPGTGCAPFRSLIQSRAGTGQQLVLFFGCRHEDQDFFFASEWRGIPNLTLFTAFSRDQKDKVYVQDRIREQGQLVWRLVSEGAVFCVAGTSKNMPFQVKDALTAVVQEHGNLTPEMSKDFIDQLVKAKLYQNETW